MTFEEAADAMKCGEKVERAGWETVYERFWAADARGMVEEYCDHSNPGKGYVRLRLEDACASDWRIVGAEARYLSEVA